MIELKELRKSYKTGDFVQKALDGVSLNFRDNEFVAVLGPSGSGKTTLLNVLGGLDHADTGELVINGVSTKDYKSADWDTYRNHHIGFIFQSYNLIPHQSVLSNVELALTLSGIPRAERKERATRALERVGLGEHIDKRPNQLSGGQMQRVAIARALVNDPDIVLADEPTGALDTETGLQVMDLLSEIASDRLVIMVTHNPELAYTYANRIVKLTDGRVSDDSNPFEIGAPQSATQAAGAPIVGGVNPAPTDATPVQATDVPSAVVGTQIVGGVNPAPTDATPVQAAAAAPSKGRKKHASMSFLTALALSFNNLMTKKGRTFLTAFAGSIGIIGIAAILALSNGVNNYIAKVEEDTLSSTPLSITKSSFDITSIMTQAGGYSRGSTEQQAAVDANVIPESTVMSDILTDVKNNDLVSLKKFLDSEESGVDKLVNAITYNYGIEPQIFKQDTSNGIKQLNPGTLKGIVSNGINSMSMFSSFGTTNAFQEMLDDQELLDKQYEVVDGRWPEKYDECVLVLSDKGRISDYTLYALGVLDPKKLEEMLKAAIQSEEIDVPDARIEFTYEDALNLTFSVVNQCNLYTLSGDGKTWTDRSDDTDYMKEQIAQGTSLKIVGIVKGRDTASSTALSEGVAYRHDLILHLIDEASASPSVIAQKEKPDTDIFTGKTFDELQNNDENTFNMSELFSVDEGAMASAFNMDTSSMSDAFSGIDSSSMNMDPNMMMTMFSQMPMPDFSGMQIDMSGVEAATAEARAEQAVALQSAISTATINSIQGFFVFALTKGFDPNNPAQVAQLSQDYVNSPEYQAMMAQSIAAAMENAGSSETSKTISDAMQKAITDAIQVEMTKYITTQLSPYLAEIMTGMMQLYAAKLSVAIVDGLGSALSGGFSFDQSAFMSAFTVNMDENDLKSLMTSYASAKELTYDNNLRKLGYADESDPLSINIYAKNFDDKQRVEDLIDKYNADMEANGEPDKSISYSDIMGVLMGSVTDIVNMISMVLIAFVAISLVVSSIMIGIITYISVLERKKEIGILRAMGASKGNVANIFNAETVIEGLMSGVFAVVLVALVSIPVNAIILEWRNIEGIMALPLGAAIILILISVLLTFIAGIMPAMNAARRDPVEALRSE